MKFILNAVLLSLFNACLIKADYNSPIVTEFDPVVAEQQVGSQSGSCQTQNGVFGSTTTGDEVVVDFEYQVEYSSVDDIDAKVAALEVQMVDYLLPQLFPDLCEAERRRLADTVLGISAKPDDKIDQDAECTDLEDENNECVVVNGALTLYVDHDAGDNERRLQTYVDNVLDTLEQGMEDDAFVGNGIERVSMLEEIGRASCRERV